MRFGSVCSGIEAASVAWGPLGWHAAWLAEIEPFPSAVLAHHYPDVPNLGDMTALPERIASGEIEAPDVFCGGTPCQAFSVAGLRKSLGDARGNLSLVFCEIADAIDAARAGRGEPAAIIFWENVPGVLSTADNAFGCFLAGLAGESDPLVAPGGKWSNAGYVLGPQRAVAWRVLDAQYFGVAQRRRRVFVVASARDDFDPAAVLFEFDGVRRDTAPSREARQVAPTIPARSTAGGGLGTDFDCDGGLQVAGTMKACKDSGGWSNSADHAAAGYMVPVRTICVATGQAGAEIGADMAPTLNCNHEAPYVAHSLRGEGFDASEDGTGRGTPLVPVGVTIHGTDPTVRKVASYDDLAQCLRARTPGNIDNSSTTVVQQPVAYAIQAGAIKTNPNIGPDGVGVRADDCAYTLEARAEVQAVAAPISYGIRTANTSSNGWGIQEEVTHTLDCAQGVAVAQPVAFHPTQDPISSTDGSTHALGCGSTGGQASVAVAVALRGREGGATAELGDEVQNCLRASSGGGDKPHVLTAMQVRRPTPTECERLQGFPDGYTDIPWTEYQRIQKRAAKAGTSFESELKKRGKVLRGPDMPACPDGPRYKALGNSWAVPNVRWIGARISAHLNPNYDLFA